MAETVVIPRHYPGFFLEYREKFILNTQKVCSIVYPGLPPGEETRLLAETVWENITRFQVPGMLPEIILQLRTRLDIRSMLVKSCYLLANDFCQFLLVRETRLDPLTSTLQFLQELLQYVDRELLAREAGESPVANRPEIESDPEIMESLTAAGNSGKVIRMHVLFQEIMISLPVKLERIEAARAWFQINPIHAKTLQTGQELFLSVEGSSRSIRGRLAELDLPRLSIMADRLVYAGTSPEKRQSVRVQPESPVKVVMTCQDKSFAGTLGDISVSGISVDLFSPASFPPDSPIRLQLVLENRLSQRNMPVQTRGKVLTIRAGSPVRLICRIFPDPIVEALISQYIAQRQIEIIRSIQKS